MKITTYKGQDLDKAFKNYARRQIKLINLYFEKLGGKVEKANIGFYYFSGFAKVKDNWIYFSISDVRHFFPNATKRLLVRKCKDDKDYTGEGNFFIDNYQSNFNLPFNI